MDRVQIFISYAREDEARVKPHYQRLLDAGFHPWLDREHILPGQRWEPVIKQALQESDFVLVCLSATSINKRGFLQREIKQALEQTSDMLEGDVYLIPARLDDCKVPDELGKWQWVDLFEKDAWDSLLRAFAFGLERRGKQMPVVVSPPRPPFDFMTFTLDERGDIAKRSLGRTGGLIEDLGNGVSLEMVSLLGGSFMMGGAPHEEESSNNECPRHLVNVQPLFIGKYPVTQAQWRIIAESNELKCRRSLNSNPSEFKGDDRLPVERVSWKDAIEFCARLVKRTGRDYRLPSEAEWEYACRAGTTTPYHFGVVISPEWVNYNGLYPYGCVPPGEYRQCTTPVGSFEVANAFGLYDMHGNVWEWCQDAWHDDYHGAPIDGSAWDESKASGRVLRGGAWIVAGKACRAATRFRYDPGERVPHIGFRVVFTAGKAG